MKLIQFIFPLTLTLCGLMAGIHFANLMGYLPALGKVEAEHVAPFWKKADEYFVRRMPVFGISLLFSLLLCIFLLRKEVDSAFFWLVASGFVLILIDLVITIKINTPVNEILRAWNGGPLPKNFEELRSQALAAFYGRAAASILSFLLMVVAYIAWHANFMRSS